MTDQTQSLVQSKTALPGTVQDLMAQRKLMQERTLNDRVDDLHVDLWPNQRYRSLLDAVYDEEAEEGSLAADNLLAAMMIRDAAREGGRDTVVATKKLATIVKALNVVLRRYGITRRERAITIDGQIVPADVA